MCYLEVGDKNVLIVGVEHISYKNRMAWWLRMTVDAEMQRIQGVGKQEGYLWMTSPKHDAFCWRKVG